MCFLPWAPSAPHSPCSFPCSSSVQSPLRSLEKFLLLTLRLRVRLAFLHEVHFEAFGRFDLLGYIGHSAPDPQPSLHPLLFHVLAPLVRRRARRLRSEEHTSELQSLRHLVCRLLLEKKKLTCE